MTAAVMYTVLCRWPVIPLLASSLMFD
jgi:hypothetical protein